MILIKPKHLPLFASWIDKKDSLHYNKKNIPYDFKLLYRSSRDGIDTVSFHRNCDNKGATIYVAKIKDSAQLIGGYNPLYWSSRDRWGEWKATSDSFLFNFTNENNVSTAKLGYVNNQGNSVFCHSNYGPTIGKLHCHLNNWTYNYNNAG